MITNVDDVVKDYRGRFLSGGWPNPDVHFTVIENWLRNLPYSFNKEETPVEEKQKEPQVKTCCGSKGLRHKKDCAVVKKVI